MFRKLRERFGIDAGDYMLSLCGAATPILRPALTPPMSCKPQSKARRPALRLAPRWTSPGDQALRELSSPGKSGSVFFLSQDGHFIVKTMRKAEMVHLRQAVLPSYFRHVMQYRETLLTKFFGLHRVKPHGGRNVRFVVMGNLFCTSLKIHRRFDLKGSTHGRLTSPGYDPESKILKDLDLDYRIKLEEGQYKVLMAQIGQDCRLLEQLNIMDYSLLLGVHFLSDKQRRAHTQLLTRRPPPAAQLSSAPAAPCRRPRPAAASRPTGASAAPEPGDEIVPQPSSALRPVVRPRHVTLPGGAAPLRRGCAPTRLAQRRRAAGRAGGGA